MASYYVTAERLKSMSISSGDEELIPLPAGKWFNTLKEAFRWAEVGDIIGSFLGWERHVYLLTPKKPVRITKVTEQMIYEDELHEAAVRIIAGVPAADVIPIVGCKDCKYKPTAPEGIKYGPEVVFSYDFDNPCPFQCGDAWYNHKPADDFFCAYGAKKNE